MANRRFIDFPIAASVGDNDIVLIWQDGLNKQTTKATLFAGSPNSLAGLTDVDISALTNGQILQYNSTTSKWENVDRTDIDLDQLGDVTIVSPTNGQVLVYNSSTSKWENSSAGFVPYTGAVTTVNLGAQSILAGSFVKAGGTSAQFLKADGSVDSTAYGTGSVTSVALTMPSAFSVANSPITTAGTLAVTGAGTVGQYVRGDGSLADFPATTGGGSSVSYYLNGSVSQGTIGGVAYRELNRTPIFGAGTDITINADGYIASFITDALDPNKLLIPAGNWNFETYFSASSAGGSPSFYVELYKYDGTTFTLIASSSAAPELIAFGTNLNPYYSTLAVPQTTLALTDRLALRYYVTHSGRTITLHTENGHLCQVITTFTTGLTALNGLTTQVQFFAVGTSGTDFNIASATATHTFNLPTASATNRGALSSTDWTTFNNKENAITAGTTAQYFRGDKTFQTLNTSVVPEGTNLYYTEARVNANTNVAANTAARHNAVTLGTANGLSLSTQVLSLGLASAGVTGALSGTDWSTFNSKQNALTLTTTGTSGDATLVGSTLNIPQYQAAGTYVTGVTASSPLASSGGTTPNITIQQASGSQSGFLSSTDWTTFNNKQNALTNPVTGTGTTNYLPKFTGSTTIGNSQIIDDGTRVGIGVSPTINKLEVGGSITVGTGVTGNTDIRFNNATNGKIHYVFSDSATGELGIEAGASVGIKFNTNGPNTRMAIFSDGNVTIGNSPSNAGFKLDVNGSGRFSGALTLTASGNRINSGNELRFYRADNAIYTQLYDGGNSNGFVLDNRNGDGFSFQSAGTNQLRISSSGNLGLGVTPSAWFSAYKVIQVGNTASFFGVGSQAYIGNNTFVNSSDNFAYITSNSATLYRQNTGIHYWYNAPSGSEGNAISFTQAMTLFSSGNLAVGPTSDAGFKLDVNGTGRFSGAVGINGVTPVAELQVGKSSDVVIAMSNSSSVTSGARGSLSWYNSSVSTVALIRAAAVTDNVGTELQFYTRPAAGSLTQVMTITSGGNVGIGTASPMSFGGFTNLTIASSTTSNQSAIFLVNSSVSIRGSWYQNGGSQINFGTATNHPLVFDTNDIERMRIHQNGNIVFKGQSTATSGESLFQNNDSALSFYSTQTSVLASKEIRFFTKVVSGEQRMTILANGNILIGTTTDTGNDRRLQVAGNLFVDDNATTGNGVQLKNADRPLITRGWDAFTSGNKTGVGRWGVYMESAELFIGSPGTDYTGGLVTIGGWLVNGTRQPNLTVNNQTRNVLIGTTTDSGDKLRVNGTTFSNEFMTLLPEAESRSNINWRFGAASIGSLTTNRRLRVKVGGVEYWIAAVEI